MHNYDAVIAGYTCLDMIPEFPESLDPSSVNDLFQPGSLIEMQGIKFKLGGVVPNTGIAMKLFGQKVFLNGLVGQDPMGDLVRRKLTELGIVEGIQTTQKDSTAQSIVLAPPGIDRIFLESPGCSRVLSMDHVHLDVVGGSKLFHFGYPPLLAKFYDQDGSMLVELFAEVKKRGTISSLDMSLMDSGCEASKSDWKYILKQVLPYTDIFAPSIEEILQIVDPEQLSQIKECKGDKDLVDAIPRKTYRDIGREILHQGAKIVLIKAGHQGAYLLTGDTKSLAQQSGNGSMKNLWIHRELWCNAFPNDPKKIHNSSGSGDIAIAAFLSSILNGEGPELALRYAGVAGRNNMYCQDLSKDLPGWKEMSDNILESKDRIEYM